MRTTRRAAAALVVLVAALSATGCAPEPAAPHTPTPTSTPLFATDEEALAAAEQAYAAYVAVIDQVLQDGGRDSRRLSGVAEGEALDQAVADAREFESMGYRTAGPTQIKTVRLQSNESNRRSGSPVVRAYVCEDVSKVDLLDREGNSLVADDRPAVTPFEVAFVKSPESEDLLVSERTIWSEVSICA